MDKVDQVLHKCTNCCPTMASTPAPTNNPLDSCTTTTCRASQPFIKPMINPIDPVDYELVERKPKRTRRPTTTEKPAAAVKEPCSKSNCILFKHRKVENGHLFECACADPVDLNLDLRSEAKVNSATSESSNKLNAEATTAVAEKSTSTTQPAPSSTSAVSTTVRSTTTVTSAAPKPDVQAREKEEGSLTQRV